jgi:thioesterase domain-containing protein/acyl carrier protein
MVPSVFVYLDSLPRMPNGKVERRTLPAPRPEKGKDENAVAPRDELEFTLTNVWQSVLNVAALGVTTNFFDLGGNSLLAVQLMSKIQKATGHKLPVSSLFQAPTIEELCGLIRTQKSTTGSPLIKLHASGTRRPFFCIHPVGGNSFCYLGLARALGTDQPFFAIQARGLAGECEPHTDIAEMAQDYVDILRKAQSEGPYLLGGWSFGGVVAFEMARQLFAAGLAVGRLVLFDSWAPMKGGRSVEHPDDARVLSWFARDLGGRFGRDIDMSEEQFRELSPGDQLPRLLELCKAVHLLPPDASLPQLMVLLKVYKANIQAVRRYAPSRYDGEITIYRARYRRRLGDVPQEHVEYDRMWSEYSSHPVNLKQALGNHYTMLASPNVELLASSLAQTLDLTRPI